MDCCNYSEYRSTPYYYWGGYPPYWGSGGGVGYPGAGYPSPQPYVPSANTPSHTPSYHPPPHVHHPRDIMDYGHAHTHTMATDYDYASKERYRRIRERERCNELHRGSLEWAECSYMPSACDTVRDTPWSYSWNQNNWQSGGRGGYPLRPVALQGGFPPPSPSMGYPHRDPLREMAAMQTTSITQEKSSLSSWDSYHGRDIEDNRIATPQPSAVSPAPRPYRSPRARDELTPGKERARKNKSPKNTMLEESSQLPPPPPPPLEPIEPPKPKPDAIPLPAFKQAFGSTEIGRFSEAFTTTGAITEDMVSKAIAQGLLGDWKVTDNWDETSEDPSLMNRSKEIKCEDSF